MKRILLLATVAALMAVMLVVSAAPAAFAHEVPCTGNRTLLFSPDNTADKDGDGWVCTKPIGGFRAQDVDDHGVGGH